MAEQLDLGARAPAVPYQDPFEAAELLPLARELTAQVCEDGRSSRAHADLILAGKCDAVSEVRAALSALKWSFYAQPGFRAAVSA